MTERELKQAREALRSGVITEPLLRELYRVAATVVQGVKLPRSLSPQGRWDLDVVEDLVGDWLEGRLLREGRLLAILDMAWTPAAFRRLAERALYQFVIGSRARSESQNIYARLVKLLEDPASPFIEVGNAQRRVDRLYALRRGSEPFTGGDRQLAAAAFAVGDLKPLRYSPSTKRLSPLISTAELGRFAQSVMTELGAALSAGQLMRALSMRLDLGAPVEEPGEDAFAEAAPAAAVLDGVAVRSAALAVLARMTRREVEVLIGNDAGETGQALARRLGCSPATVHNDQRRIGYYIDDFADNDDERKAIANTIVELVHAALAQDKRADGD